MRTKILLFLLCTFAVAQVTQSKADDTMIVKIMSKGSGIFLVKHERDGKNPWITNPSYRPQCFDLIVSITGTLSQSTPPIKIEISGNASYGTDYEIAVPGITYSVDDVNCGDAKKKILTIGPQFGGTSFDIQVIPINDAIAEADESITLKVLPNSAPEHSGGATSYGTNEYNQITAIILDDDHWKIDIKDSDHNNTTTTVSIDEDDFKILTLLRVPQEKRRALDTTYPITVETCFSCRTEKGKSNSNLVSLYPNQGPATKELFTIGANVTDRRIAFNSPANSINSDAIESVTLGKAYVGDNQKVTIPLEQTNGSNKSMTINIKNKN